MRLLDLFAGIGGFSLAAHWMGWQTVAFVEWDKYCQKVLKKNFPNIPIYGDIREFDGTQYRGAIDIICGGFPCQPFSSAGKREGTADDRYLWPEMLRVIKDVQPSWVVGENVAGILTMDRGGVFEKIVTDLENIGYKTESFVIPACAVGFDQLRNRVWIIAHNNKIHRFDVGKCGANGIQQRNEEIRCKNRIEFHLDPGEVAYSKWECQGYGIDTRPIFVRNIHGVSSGLDPIGRLGNAIVPHIAYEFYRAIEKVNNHDNNHPERRTPPQSGRTPGPR